MDIRIDVSASSPDAAAEQTEFSYITELPTDTPCGYLVDLARFPEALRLLFELDPVPVYDLPWIYTQSQEEAYAGPILIIPERDACSEWLRASYQEGKALALYGSNLSLDSISQHLVTLNKVMTPYGESLFRYADSASLGTLGASLTALQRQQVLGPLAALHGCYNDTFWALQSCSDGNQATLPEATGPLSLGRDNLAAVEAHRKDLLIRAFADSSKRPEPIIRHWCQQLEELGAPSEQGLVEGMEVLIQAGFRQPLTATELTTARTSSDVWSGRLEALAQIVPQEGP